MDDQWEIYEEMVAYGASPIEVARQAWSNGLNTADATYLIEELFTLHDEQIREVIAYGYGQKYIQMVENGASPNDVLAEANKDRIGKLLTINILRFLFDMLQDKVGEMMGMDAREIGDLWNYPIEPDW